MNLRTEPAHCGPILAQRMVGRYRVIVFPYSPTDPEPVYQVQVEVWDGMWRKVCCGTRADEKRYPKRAAQAGFEMVNAVKAGLFSSPTLRA
jgi:hypothetical protein